MSTGWAIAQLVVLVLLVVAMGFAFRRRGGQLLPFVIAVVAGMVAVWLVTTVVLLTL